MEYYMKLWTIISQEQLDYLNKYGFLKADGRRIDSYFRNAYKWLIKQMDEHIGPSPKGIMYPIWAYYQWDGADNPRPDLRNIRYDWCVPGIYYRLELNIDKERIFLSDYEGWHSVLNSWHFSLNEKEFDEFDKILEDECSIFGQQKTYSKEVMQKIEDSWQRIIDMNSPRDKHWHGSDKIEDIQATFWILYKKDIVKMDRFESVETKGY